MCAEEAQTPETEKGKMNTQDEEDIDKEDEIRTTRKRELQGKRLEKENLRRERTIVEERNKERQTRIKTQER